MPAGATRRAFPLLNARAFLTGAFQNNAFGCGRYNPQGKSSGPALLEPSLKVKRNNVHGQSSAFKVAPVLGHLNAHARLKGPRARRNECHGGDLVGTTRC